MTKQIVLTQGKFAIVDDHRFEYLNQFNWHAIQVRNTGKWYAQRAVCKHPQKNITMHREIMNAPDGTQVDHRDGDGLNNVDENLRECTNTQNTRNRGKQRNNTSGFKGVYSHRGKYRAKIWVDNKIIHLGVFNTAEEAAHARDEAAIKYHGEFAWTNFPSTHEGSDNSMLAQLQDAGYGSAGPL